MAQSETILLGGGCFWCVEAAFELVPGVRQVTVGYAGGRLPNPSYEQVSSGTTGHIEVARVEFDPSVVSLEQILALFWKIHDPTSRDRQGADEGSQYRSAIFYTSDSQREPLLAAIKAEQRHWDKPIVTELRPLGAYWLAEEYHQDYYRKNPSAGYCQAVIAPKLKKAGLAK